MDSINSSKFFHAAVKAAKGSVFAAFAALILAAAATAIWRGPAETKGILIGLGIAWLSSSLSSCALLLSTALERAPERLRAFWWAFGGGMALRLATLGALAFYVFGGTQVSPEALLLSYAFGVFILLFLEYRHLGLLLIDRKKPEAASPRAAGISP